MTPEDRIAAVYQARINLALAILNHRPPTEQTARSATLALAGASIETIAAYEQAMRDDKGDAA